MHKKGFSLIELMVVVTIIAILAGGSIPFIQGYIDEARIAKAKDNLVTLRNAIQRFEVEHGYIYKPLDQTASPPVLNVTSLNNYQKELIGPYISNVITDPWGRPFYYSYAGSFIVSGAQDGKIDTNVIMIDVRPPFAPTKAWFVDKNRNGIIDTDDEIRIRFTRPIGVLAATDVSRRASPAEAFEDATSLALVTDDAKKPGDEWAIFTVTADTNLKVGDEISIKDTAKDASPACGTDAAQGIYTTKLINEDLHTRAGVTSVDSLATAKGCQPTTVILKAAQ